MYAKKMTLLAALLAAASGANAAAPQVDFTVEAVVPDTEFYVTPVNGWDAQTQKMTWNAATESLNPLSQQLKMKNGGGGIKAYLSGQPVLTSSSSNNTIELQVEVAGQVLDTTSTGALTLFNDIEAKLEKTATMTVSQKSGAKPDAGTYMGAVTMMFDTAAP